MIDELLENAIEIAWEDQWLLDSNRYDAEVSSWDEKEKIIELAKGFLGKRDTFERKGDYYTTIHKYAYNELMEAFGSKEEKEKIKKKREEEEKGKGKGKGAK